MAGTNSEQIKQDLARRYSFFKKRMKARKISKNQLHQEFVHRGWDACSFDFSGESHNSKRIQTKHAASSLELFGTGSMKDVQIIYSPCKFEKRISESSPENHTCSFERKSMLVDIGNIKAEFSNHQSKSCNSVQSWNSKNNFPFLKEKVKRKCFHLSEKEPKRLNSSILFKVQDIQAAFKIETIPICKKPLTNSQNDADFESVSPSETTETADDKQDSTTFHHEPFQNCIQSFSSSNIDRTNFAGINALAKNLMSKNYCIVSKKDSFSNSFPDLSSFEPTTEANLKKSRDIISGTKFNIESIDHTNQVAKELHNLYSVTNLRALLKDNAASGDKGSNWVQSIKWSNVATKEDNLEYSENTGKKKFRNFVPGGFAEQLLKLQRREKSDKVIWDHKLTEMRKKDSKNFLTFKSISVAHFGEIIVTKCSLIECHEADSNIICNDEILHSDNTDVAVSSCENLLQTDAKTYILLFRKSVFSKNHLRHKSVFRLFQPWHAISVPNLACPVILCTYFVEVLTQLTRDEIKSEDQKSSVKSNNSKQSDVKQEETFKKDVDFNTYVFPKSSLSAEQQNIHNLWGKGISLVVRIQRIWQNKICCERVNELIKIKDYLSFTMLLETKDGTFCILKIKAWNGCLPEFWFNLIADGEGSCYLFHNLKIAYRFHIKNNPELFRILKMYRKTLCDNKEEVMPQDICYQLIPWSLHEMPNKVEDTLFPKFYSFKILTLATLPKIKMDKTRFSCFGKVMFHILDYFYLTDESLLNSPVKYIRFRFFYPSKMIKESLVGTTVLIKEAIINEGSLLIDEYSSCKIMPLKSYLSLSKMHQNRLKSIKSISAQHIVSPLNFSSRINDVVYIEGIITHVDTNSAVSWFECCFCFKENLLQDANSIVYCEDCSCVVSKPILNVKMEVTVCCPYIFDAIMSVLLLPSTIKAILKINDDSYQPQCNINDVLKKKLSSLLCYIRDCKIVDGKKWFCLTEIK